MCYILLVKGLDEDICALQDTQRGIQFGERMLYPRNAAHHFRAIDRKWPIGCAR